jgi:hypothetical protein
MLCKIDSVSDPDLQDSYLFRPQNPLLFVRIRILLLLMLEGVEHFLIALLLSLIMECAAVGLPDVHPPGEV